MHCSSFLMGMHQLQVQERTAGAQRDSLNVTLSLTIFPLYSAVRNALFVTEEHSLLHSVIRADTGRLLLKPPGPSPPGTAAVPSSACARSWAETAPLPPAPSLPGHLLLCTLLSTGLKAGESQEVTRRL